MIRYGFATLIALVVAVGCSKPGFRNDPTAMELSQAAATSLEATVRLVEEKDADVNAQYGWGESALFAAINLGKADVVQYLLNKGADPNPNAASEDSTKGSALHASAKAGQAECMALILQSGFKEIEDPIKRISALTDATNLACAKLLVEAGADLHYTDCWKRGVLSSQVREDRLDVLKYLLSKGAKVHEGFGYMTAAARGDSPQALNILKSYGGNVNEEYTVFWTYKSVRSPIHAAVAHPRTLKWLLKSGADIDKQTSEGQTALHIACDQAHLESVELLLKSGANPNAKEALGRTPLHIVCFGRGGERWEKVGPGHTKRIKQTIALLVKHGADVNAKDKNGWTPLFRAATMGRSEAVAQLLSLGANPATKDLKGRSAADLARELEQGRVAIALEGAK
jgi:ankyrin repeat protein